MVKDFSENDLFKRLDATNREREQVYEQAHQVSVERFTRNLTAINKSALDFYANAIEWWTTSMNVGQVLVAMVLIGGAFSMGIYGAHWLAIKWTEDNVDVLTSQTAELQVEIEAQKKTIERLNSKTWSVLLHEDEKGRFVVLPAGEIEDWDGRYIRGRPAYQLKDR